MKDTAPTHSSGFQVNSIMDAERAASIVYRLVTMRSPHPTLIYTSIVRGRTAGSKGTQRPGLRRYSPWTPAAYGAQPPGTARHPSSGRARRSPRR